MALRQVVRLVAWAGIGLAAASCGSNATSPAASSSPGVVTQAKTPTATPSPTPSPTPSGSNGLPAGMVCSSPTPPPILRMQIGVHDDTVGRKVLDSKPLVANVDGYCDKVGFGDWKFCDTRPEGHPERVACDYLVTGQAEDTGRWGPTWFYRTDLCAYFPDECANHPSNQFMVVAKGKGTYEACAAETWPVASGGTRCGTIEIQ